MKNLPIILAILILASAAAVIMFNRSDKNIPETMVQEIFIDVRTIEEWNEGHLDGAVHFELAKLENGEIPEVPKDSKIAVYCRSGNRAGQAKAILEAKGFEEVRNAGGLAEANPGVKICRGETPSC